MKHDLHIGGFAFDLRPITLEDADFIVELRSDRQHCRFLRPFPLTLETQRAYLEEYFRREGDYYFVVERRRDNHREGLAAIYDVNLEKRCAEWGRWILRPHSLAAAECALRIYEAAFDHLHLDEVYCRTIAKNEQVVGFHDRCGLARRAILPGYASFEGTTYDSIEQVLTRENWPRVRRSMELKARLIARRIEGS